LIWRRHNYHQLEFALELPHEMRYQGLVAKRQQSLRATHA
jgi:hypothetical protein